MPVVIDSPVLNSLYLYTEKISFIAETLHTDLRTNALISFPMLIIIDSSVFNSLHLFTAKFLFISESLYRIVCKTIYSIQLTLIRSQA